MAGTVKPYSHRTFLELSVGTTHTVQVVIHLRRSDLEWFNNPNDLPDHQSQLFNLIGRRILPQECGEEIETDLAAWRRKRRKIGVLIGEKNIAAGGAQSSSAPSSSSTLGKGKKKGGRAVSGRGKKGGGRKGTNAKAGTKISLAALAGGSKKGAKTKRNVDVVYLFADTLQVTYRVENVSTSDSVTLLFNDPVDVSAAAKERPKAESSGKDGIDVMSKKRSAAISADPGDTKKDRAKNAGNSLATFRQLKKLSKRIVIWVYPFDPTNPTAPNPEGGGFPRPELIPLTSLFPHRDEE